VALGVSATLCSIPLSVICYHYFELPSIEAGKRAYPMMGRLLQGPPQVAHVPAEVDFGAASADDTAPRVLRVMPDRSSA
jgi:peptidoglycan/LPS O-acetylase OafA/YrhL